MNSTNGTFVNNEKIVKSKLANDDVVTLGSTRFRFALEDEATVRHIATIFKKKNNADTRHTLVDSLIETELTHSAGRNTIELSVLYHCLLYTSPSPRDATLSRMPSSA